MSALPAVPAPVTIQPGRGQRDAATRITLPGPASPHLAPGVGLAAEIRRIRQQLASLDTVSNPRVLTELHELYTLVAARLDQRRGRHRLDACAATTDEPCPRPRPVIAEPMPDVSGLDLRPDPLAATTAAELVDALRRYRQWAGDPSLRTMAAQAGQQVAHSTMYVALSGTTLPKLRVILAIVAGCGGGHGDQRAFVTAWRRIKAGDPGTAPARSADLRVG